jgi:hypothetical protein
MMEMLEEHQMGLPYGCLVTRICMRFLKDILASELDVKPKRAFGKHIVMKSNAQLQRHMDPEEQVDPAPPAHPEPSSASSSQGPSYGDAVLSALEHITGQLQSKQAQFQSMDTRLTKHFQSVDERFLVLDAKVERVRINMEKYHLHQGTDNEGV